ncbi:hypothetical protein P7C70_g4462, partial [Phenoliferia sp. Uapishka_3]
MEPLRPILESDQLRQTADGWWRWCRAYLGCQPVDYPDGGWLLSVLKNWVVWSVIYLLVCTNPDYALTFSPLSCEAAPDQLGDGAGVPRTSESSAAHRALGAEHARSFGLHMEEVSTFLVWCEVVVGTVRADSIHRQPYYHKFGIDGHALIISDLLHQLTKGQRQPHTSRESQLKLPLHPLPGVFKDWTLDHLIKVYLKNAAGGGAPYDRVMREIARRMEVLPPFSALRRFKDGIEFTNWTGKDSKALMATVSSALWDLSWGEDGTESFRTALDKVTQSITWVVIIYLYVTGLESTATDRQMQQAAITLYMEVIRYAFADEREGKGFNWARLHSMFHYIEWTELNGTAPHSDTSHYETAHIKAVKEPYRASNRCNATVQILRANTRRDCLAALRGRLELQGVIPTLRPMLPPVYQKPLTTLPGQGDRRKRTRLENLAQDRDLPGLAKATSDFLSIYLNIPDFEFPGKVEVHTIATASFPVYEAPAYLSNDTCKLMTQRLYATNEYAYRGEVGCVSGPRHDTLLVQGARHAELGGESFEAYDVFRAQMFFVVGYRGRRIELCLGEEYKKEPNHEARKAVMLPVVSPVDVDGNPVLRVFLVSDILRAVHLQPLFGKQGVPKDLTFMETLDRWRGSYAVGVFTDQHIFRLLFRPDAKRYLQSMPRN